MYIEVRRAVLTIKCRHLDFDTLNNMLQAALKYDFCDLDVADDDRNTMFELTFKQDRSSVFVEQWVMFWMRPFGLEYSLDFELPENGRNLSKIPSPLAAV